MEQRMTCPRCMKGDTTIISGTHYVCDDPNCVGEDGKRTQFQFVKDTRVRFPYNQIFVDRPVEEFYRKPYLQIESSGVRTLAL